MHLVQVFVVILAVVKAFQGAPDCGVEKSSNLAHHNPWLVFLMYFNNGHLSHTRCGGTLIDSRHILTAAHCILKPKFSILKARLGEYDIDAKLECVQGVCTDRVLDIDVEEIIVHPEYNGKEHDLAVLRLKKEAPYTDFIRPVCLPTGQLADDATFVAAGWGIIPRRGEYSHIKKIIPLPYVKRDACQAAYKNIDIPKIALCAGGEAGVDTCSGDSGGPLVQIKERIELWGVTSSGNVHCGTKGTPGIYMSVKDHLDWINKVVRESNAPNLKMALS